MDKPAEILCSSSADSDEEAVDVERWRIFRSHGDDVWWREDNGTVHHGTTTGGGDDDTAKVIPDGHGGCWDPTTINPDPLWH